MIIRVDSIDNLTKDVADCIHTPISKMLSDIRSINFRMSDERGIDYLTSHEHEKLTEVYLCHLARRLKASFAKPEPQSNTKTDAGTARRRKNNKYWKYKRCSVVYCKIVP